MITPIVGQLYRETRSGMVVIAVTRYPNENNLRRFPGRVLFPGKAATWTNVGNRVPNLSINNFEPVKAGQRARIERLSNADQRTGGAV